ncbi:MAG: formylglycine-generating enzyme family protein [Cyanobacteriota bacterium]
MDTPLNGYDLFDAGEHEWRWRDYLVKNPVSAQFGAVLDKMIVFGTKKRYIGAGEVLQDLGINQSQRSAPVNQPKITVPATPRIQVSSSSPKNLTEVLPGGVKLELVKIPAGSFLMGSNESEREKPVHRVTLQEFYLGKYPVTQEQWQAIMGNNPSNFRGNLFIRNPKNPVEQVSWNDCKDFCEKLSHLTSQKYKLPTESEWEYACRAGTETRYYFGDSERMLGDYAWWYGNSDSTPHPVGQKPPNRWGLYDIHGNVWEWCEDNWHPNYRLAPTDGSAWNDNSFLKGGKVVRSGSWHSYLTSCRSAYRSLSATDYCTSYVGFRVVCVRPRLS